MSEISDLKIWVVGDRCQILTPKKYSGEKGYVCGFHADDSAEIWVKLDNHDLQIRVFPEEIRFLEETVRLKINKSKPSDCWYTPTEIVNLIQQCLNGITLDPCADDGKHIEACQHLTASDDGLSQQWSGRVFMNPPYSCPGLWIAKLQEEFNLGRVEEAIALVPVATDTKWFHPLISSNLICFWKGRIKFLDATYQPKMPARQSHCLIFWGKNPTRFRQVFSPFGSFNLLEERGSNLYSLGSKVKVTNPQKYYSDWDWGIVTGLTIKNEKIDVQMGDRFIIAVDIADLFLEDEGAMSTTTPKENAECNNLNNLTFAQELVQDSQLPLQNLEDLSLSEPQKLIPTAQVSLQDDSQECITTETFKHLSTLKDSDCDPEQLISSPLPPLAPHSLQKGSAGEPMIDETVSRQSSKLSQITNPDLPSSKTSPVCSPAPTAQEMSAVTSGMFYSSFPPAGTMRNGLLLEADTVMLPSLESEYCWLPSPGALSLSGKGRPPGQTKQEAGLKKLKAIAPGQVVNPEFLESAYRLPLGWTDLQESRSALELLAEMELSELAAQPLETPLIGELPPSDFAVSPTGATRFSEVGQKRVTMLHSAGSDR